MTNKSGLLPMEFNVVVEMDPIEEITASGIILPASKTDRDKLAAEEGTLVALSPLAFTYAEWPENERKPQAGDRVLFARYSGALWPPEAKPHEPQFRILKDKEIVAVIEQPAALAEAA